MCYKTKKSSNKTTLLDNTTLKSLLQQYCDKKIKMKQLMSIIKKSRRQITRIVKCYRETGVISTARGYGSHLPYNQKDCDLLFKLLWNMVNDEEIATILGIPVKRLKRHKKVISLPIYNFGLEWDENKEICTFTVYIESLSLKNSVIRIILIINVKLVEIKERVVDFVEKRNLCLLSSYSEYYYQFVNWFLTTISASYFQKLKMRTMDQMSELERIKTYQDYYYNIINNIESSELLEHILPIIYNDKTISTPVAVNEQNERKLSIQIF